MVGKKDQASKARKKKSSNHNGCRVLDVARANVRVVGANQNDDIHLGNEEAGHS